MVREQTAFVKKYRKLIHTGDFHRLKSPFEGNLAAWMVVSQDKRQAIVACFKILNDINSEFRRLSLKGLNEELLYEVESEGREIGEFFGNEMMNIGLITSDSSLNSEFRRLSLKGLNEELLYEVESEGREIGEFFGNEMMNIGLITSDSSSGETNADTACGDFWSKIYVLNAK